MLRKPLRIFLVRHGESEANLDRSVNRRFPDHAISLTDKGRKQARRAGEWLSGYFQKSPHGYPLSTRKSLKIRLWNSPYRRTRQTADEIYSSCMASHGVHPLIYDRREHTLLCEQQFGLFDGIPDDELKDAYPDEYAHYQKCMDFEGRFWARMPLGESRFDVANRVHHAFGTFHRDYDRHDIRNIIVVCHGVVLRAFLMMWFHHTPEWFDEEPNPKNCAIRLIDGKDQGYIYEGED